MLEPSEAVDVPLEVSVLVFWRPIPGQTLWVLVGVHPERPGTDDWYTTRCYPKNAAPDRFTCDRVRFGRNLQQHGPWDLVAVQVPEHEYMEQYVGVGYLKPIETLPISARSRTYQYRR
ncbi:hypothetical protein Val02_54710 [Virgisporangium aliadipatigenens]|uniref:Uncharacterized protein n=1 Tax=Virgisporangium aliadipatigenens TaxID=741659 RepID=A0A8J3YRF1_9ACTN|nr:hypothetical protein [Virgisporangium aliadipatigenens]GIJ48585.1 hypothetical protein Val02_54710 [Virgisporangium aliadipatigenens]